MQDGDADVRSAWRVGDEERERVQRLLGEHYALGFLDDQEHDARSAAAAAARTRADLDPLVADLLGAVRQGWHDRGLRVHTVVFIAGSVALVLTWSLTRDPTPAAIDEGAGYYWPFWVVFVWAALVAGHALRAHGLLPHLPWARMSAGPTAEEPSLADPALRSLTEREREILALVGGGCANKEIARRLGISERTARTHVSNVLRKLDVDSRTQAALVAVRAGLGPGDAGTSA
jgi:DNA-binding CsgD family transcriptional regulator